MANQQLSDYTLLKELTQQFGPSGKEKEVKDFISSRVKPYADSITIDPLGNLIVSRSGQGKKIMIACHMDEVGIIVTHIDDRGYLYFAPVGGVKPTELIGKRVVFKNKRFGIVSKVRKNEGTHKTPEKIFIDIGVTSEPEARKIVEEGDMAVLAGDFQETDGCIISKALDNRIGCFLAMEVLKRIKSEHELFFTFTSQEEVGARGAKTAAYAIRPHLALIIDTTISYDTPQEKYRTSLGGGVAIKAMDRSIIVSPKIKNWMAAVASQKNIDFQWEIITTGGTDSGPVHLTGGGIPTGGIALPVRYLHSGNEIAAKSDLTAAYNLLVELLLNPYEE